MQVGTRADVVFVCTPPVFHVPQAMQAVQTGAHVFIEKPLSHSLDGVDALIAAAEASHRVVQVGYNLHFHPGLTRAKQLMEEGAIGRIRWAQVEVGQYLPDWRPWQDYRQSYTAQRDLGGGIILDASHELDYVIWLLGQPTELVCMAGKVSNLEVDVEDCTTVLLRFVSGAQADVHMDFLQCRYTRSCKLVGDQAIRIVEKAMGEVCYELSDREVASRAIRRSLFVVKDMKAGDIFSEDNIRSIRPGHGLHTRLLQEVLGQKAAQDLRRGTPLRWEFISGGSNLI